MADTDVDIEILLYPYVPYNCGSAWDTKIVPVYDVCVTNSDFISLSCIYEYAE